MRFYTLFLLIFFNSSIYCGRIFIRNNNIFCKDCPLWCWNHNKKDATGPCDQCKPFCGDGLVQDTEECDTGNMQDGGCINCKIDAEYLCNNSRSEEQLQTTQAQVYFLSTDQYFKCFDRTMLLLDERPFDNPSTCYRKVQIIETKDNTVLILQISIPIGILFLILIACLCIVIYYLRLRNNFTKYMKKQLGIDKTSFLINEKDLTLLHKLGSGNFGTVSLGLLRNSSKVAVKKVKDTEDDDISFYGKHDNGNIVREAKMMSSIPHHTNIVSFIGICLSEKHKSLMIVTEFMSLGSLDQYLKNNRNEMNKNSLTEILQGITSGMDYLHSFEIIHNDLAARNILLCINYTGSNKEFISKVSDFGLSKLTNSRLTETRSAILWTAPEVIKDRRSVSYASDVWSFGVTSWEILTFCQKSVTLLDNLINKEGCEKYRLEEDIEDKVFIEVITSCCNKIISKRPSFKELYQLININSITKQEIEMNDIKILYQ